MRTLVIGTAGHIDHGKTSLVRALTGVDTDRWKEEQERGITIDLGFAHLDLADDLRASIVDVPGHERFVKNMVAGTGGIDLVMMTVAADEGIMPQTREHLDICSLLGVKRGLVALTKTDMVDDPEWIPMVTEDIRREFEQTFLADCPIVPLSSRSGEGIEDLIQILTVLGRDLEQRPDSGMAFLAIDRSFSMKGFGTVITGTLVSGRLALEDEVDVLPDPAGRLAGLKVRGLQSHGEDLAQAGPGQRLAINISGVERQVLHRGQVLVASGALRPSRWIEGSLQVLEGAHPIRDRALVTLHTGTAKTQARIQLIDSDKLAPGQTGLVRIRFEDELAVLPGQRYLLRGTNPIQGRGTTMAGGEIHIILPPRRRKREREAWIAELKAVASGDLDAAILTTLSHVGVEGATPGELAMRTGRSTKKVEQGLQNLLQRRSVFKFDRERGRHISAQVLEHMASRAEEALKAFHTAQPLLPGMPTEQLRTSLRPRPEPRVFRFLVAEMTKQGRIALEEETTRLIGHEVMLDANDTATQERVLRTYREAKLAPPRVKEVADELGQGPEALRDLLQHLVRQGSLIHIAGDMYACTQAVEELKQRLLDHFDTADSINTQEFKTMVGTTRKHVIPLAEYFDGQKITMRVGDKRVRRGRSQGG
ncbi:MAG: selenocysteine-specific translation elongation factor [Deltaproteobacteria bacterium]|nr:selenocysteine-specific translation elongation factor [Deltaproteobacteria bacterium]